MRRKVLYCFVGILFTGLLPARAGTKEEIMRLQNDVLALQEQIRTMEKSFGEQMDVLKSLVIQLNDQVGKESLMITRISSTLQGQTSGGNQANQVLIEEMRSISTRLDDASTRISALAQQVADLKVQASPISSISGQSEASATGLSIDAAFSQAYNDLVQGSLDMAIQEFTTFVKTYPGSEKADDAQYYIGEAYFNQNKLPQAIAAFTKVLTDYPAGDKIPSSLFKRGKAELAQQEKQNATADFKAVIQKYPSSPEAALAQSELKNLGVGTTAPKSTPVKRNAR
jgi:tol-pal system protein YbgF